MGMGSFSAMLPMLGMDALGAGIGGMFGQQQTSPLIGMGLGEAQTGLGGLNSTANQYQSLYGNVSPYVGGAMAQGQGDIQHLLGIYQNPQAYMNNLRTTTALGQFMPGGYAQGNAMGTAGAYMNANNRGLSSAGGAAPSSLAGSQAYMNNSLMGQYGGAQQSLGQMQANLPLQFGQDAAQLASGNASNLMGQAQGLTGAQGNLYSGMVGQGAGMVGQGFQQGMDQSQMTNQALGGMLGGLGSMFGMGQAGKLFGMGQGGAGAGGGMGAMPFMAGGGSGGGTGMPVGWGGGMPLGMGGGMMNPQLAMMMYGGMGN